MNKIVLDSSAILALLKMEEGNKIVAEKLDDAVISSVNFSEVLTVVARKGFGQKEVIESLKNTFLHIVDFNSEQAIIAASLDKITRQYGLSLGDRACLALAKYKNCSVLTADKVWRDLELDIDVQLIR